MLPLALGLGAAGAAHADLIVSHLFDADVPAGARIKYTVVLKETSLEARSGVELLFRFNDNVVSYDGTRRDDNSTILPPGVVCTGMTVGQAGPGTVRCTGINIPENTEVTLEFFAKTTVRGTTSVHAEITGGTQAADQNTSINAGSDLELALDAPGSTSSGGSMTVLLSYTNRGPNDSPLQSLVYIVPAGFEPRSFPNCLRPNLSTITCDGSALRVGATATFTVTGLVTAANTSNLRHVAGVTANGAVEDPISSNNSADKATAVTPGKQLALSKSITTQSRPIKVDDVFTYTLDSTFSGDYPTGAQLVDTLPAEVCVPQPMNVTTQAKWSCSVDKYCSAADGGGGATLTCNLTAPAPNSNINNNAALGQVILTVKARAASNRVLNSATLSAPDAISVTAGAETYIVRPGINLRGRKSAVSNKTIAALNGSVGDATVRYSVGATNQGPNDLPAGSTYVLVEHLPRGLTLVGISRDGGVSSYSCDQPLPLVGSDTTTLNCAVTVTNRVAANASVPGLELTTRATEARQLTNRACVIYPLDEPEHDCASVDLKILAEGLDMKVLKRVIGKGNTELNRQDAGLPLVWEIEIVNKTNRTAGTWYLNDAFANGLWRMPHPVRVIPGVADMGACSLTKSGARFLLSCTINSLPPCISSETAGDAGTCPRVQVSAYHFQPESDSGANEFTALNASATISTTADYDTYLDDNFVNNTPGYLKGAVDLSANTRASFSTVGAGQLLTYTNEVVYPVASSQLKSVRDVVLTNNLPLGVVLLEAPVASNGATCTAPPLNQVITYDSPPVRCTWPSLSRGVDPISESALNSLRVENVVVKVRPGAALRGSSIINSVAVESSTPDLNSANNTARVSTSVGNPVFDLVVDNNDDVDPVLAGQDVTYSLSVRNYAASTAEGIALSFQLSNQAGAPTYVGYEAPAGVSCDTSQVLAGRSTGTLRCSIALIGGSTSGNTGETPVESIVKVKLKGVTAGSYTSSANVQFIAPGLSAFETQLGNNTETEATYVTSFATDVEVVSKLAVASGTTTPQSVITPSVTTFDWRIHLRNNASQQADGVVFTDTLPNGMLITGTPNLQVTAGSFSYVCATSVDRRTFSCTISSMPGRAEAIVTIPVVFTSVPAVGSSFANTASLVTTRSLDTEGGSDPAAGNNYKTGTVTVTTGPQADVEVLSKTAVVTNTATPKDSAQPLEGFDYLVLVRNNGPVAAQTVQFTDTLPPGMVLTGTPTFTVTSGTFVPAAPSCTGLAGATATTCDITTMPVGATATVRIPVQLTGSPAPDTVFANTASIVTTGTADTNGGPSRSEGNNFKRGNISVAPRADVQVLSKAAVATNTATAKASAQPLENFDFLVQLKNNGPAAAQTVQFADDLPPGMELTGRPVFTVTAGSFVPAAPTCTGAASGTAFTCDVITMPADGTATVRIPVRLTGSPAPGTPFGNTASIVTTGTPDTDGGASRTAGNNHNSGSITVAPRADMQVLSKAAVATNTATAKASAQPLENFDFLVRVKNNGPSDAQAVRFADDLPPGMELTGRPVFTVTAGTFVPAAPTCTGAAGDTSFTCDVTTMPTDGTATVRIPVRLTGSPAPGTPFSNTASIVTTGTPDTDGGASRTAGNNHNSGSITVGARADVQVLSKAAVATNTATAKASAQPLENFDFLVRVKNNGPADAQTVRFADDLPPGMELTGRPVFAVTAGTFVPAAPTCTGAAGDISFTCDVTTMPADGAATVRIPVRLTGSPAPGTPFSNTASIVTTGTLDTDGGTSRTAGNNHNSGSITVGTPTTADVQVLSKAAVATNTATAKASAQPLENFDFLVQLKNNGPAAAQTVQFADDLPPGMELTGRPVFTVTAGSFVPAAPTCTGAAAGTAFTCDVITMPADGTATVRIPVRLTGTPAPGTPFSNTASIVTTGTPDTNGGASRTAGNNHNSGSITVAPRADVQVLSKVAVATNTATAKASAVSMENFDFLARVINNGPSDAQTVQFADDLPPGMELTGRPVFTVTAGTFVPAAPTCTGAASGTAFTCDVTTMPAGGAATVRIPVRLTGTPTDGTPFTNTASIVTTGTPDTDGGASRTGGNNFNSGSIGSALPTADTQVVSKAAVVHNGTAAQGPVRAAQVFDWLVQLRNNGPQEARTVRFSDTLPDGMVLAGAPVFTVTGGTFVPATPTCSGTVGGGSVTCDVTSMPAGGTATVRIPVQLTGEPAGAAVFTNTATLVTTGSVDTNGGSVPGAGNNHNSGTVRAVDKADVQAVSKAAVAANTTTPKATAISGEVFDWLVVVRNNGPQAAETVVFADDLPTGMVLAGRPVFTVTAGTFTPAAPTCTGADGGAAFTCAITTMPANGAATVRIPVRLTGTPAANTPFTNTASIVTTGTLDTDGGTSRTGGNNFSSGSIRSALPTADTQVVSKAAVVHNGTAAQGPVRGGQVFDWLIQLRNNGPQEARTVRFSDTLPGGMVLAGAPVFTVTGGTFVPAAPTCSGTVGGGSVTCDVTTMPAGGTATVRIPVQLTGEPAGAAVFTNTATLVTTGSVDTNGGSTPLAGNNHGSGTVAALAKADVQVVSKAAVAANTTTPKATAVVGEVFDWLVAVRNNGPQAAETVRFADDLPPGMALAGTPAFTVTAGAFTPSCTGGEGGTAVACTIASMPAGGAATVRIPVRVTASLAADAVFTNTASIVTTGTLDTNGGTDPRGGNNHASGSIRGTPASMADVQVLSKLAVNSGTTTAKASAKALEPFDFLVRLANNGPLAAAAVRFSDTLPAGMVLAGTPAFTVTQGSFTPATPTCSGAAGGNKVVCDYASMPAGGTATVRIPVMLTGDLSLGGTYTNTATLITQQTPDGNGGADPLGGNNFARGSIAMQPAFVTSSVSGRVWMDADHDRSYNPGASNPGEAAIPGWTVELAECPAAPAQCTTANATLVRQITSGSEGQYGFDGVPAGRYIVRFRNLRGYLVGGVWPTDPLLNGATGVLPRQKGSATQDSIELYAGLKQSIVNQDLPLDPGGVVYDSLSATPVAGAAVRISGPAGFNAQAHVLDGSDTVTTTASGQYRFLLMPDAPAGVYTLAVTPPAGYRVSARIPPASATLSMLDCRAPGITLADQDGTDPCRVSLQDKPALPIPAPYFLSVYFPGAGRSAQGVVNNHIPLDSDAAATQLIELRKTTPKLTVKKGEPVPYTITARYSGAGTFAGVSLVDTLPPGFKYLEGSLTVQTLPSGAVIPVRPLLQGRRLTLENLQFAAGETKKIRMVLAVGVGVGEGDYVNSVVARRGGSDVSNTASATVRVVPDALLDCTDVIGKVYDDRNANGWQDEDEPGLPNVRIATVNGLLVNTDALGRYHVACAAVPKDGTGSNLVLKLDERTLPSGYRVTTENPAAERITRGKAVKVNFGATVHRVVRLSLQSAAFDAGAPTLQAGHEQRLAQALAALRERPSILRLAYEAGADEDPALADARLQAVREELLRRWREDGQGQAQPLFNLDVEVERVPASTPPARR